MFFYDTSFFIFMVPAFVLMLITQWYVNSAYKKWGRVASRNHITGKDAAERLIRAAGLYDVKLEEVSGKLTDHYDPRGKVLRLSSGVAQGSSIAALAIAAHELGHAVQDEEDYLPLRFRAALIPAVNIGSNLGWILIFIGLAIGLTGIAWLGVIFFGTSALFSLATLPVELNASARARVLLDSAGLISDENERHGVNTVLNAAALTYVAALVTAVLQLLRFVFIVLRMGRRR